MARQRRRVPAAQHQPPDIADNAREWHDAVQPYMQQGLLQAGGCTAHTAGGGYQARDCRTPGQMDMNQ